MMRYPVLGFVCGHPGGLVVSTPGSTLTWPRAGSAPPDREHVQYRDRRRLHTHRPTLRARIRPGRDRCPAVVSHLHFDDTGGTAWLTNARIVVSAPRIGRPPRPRVVELGGSDPTTFDMATMSSCSTNPTTCSATAAELVPTVATRRAISRYPWIVT